MAEMTSASALRDLLMAYVSLSLSPSTFVKFNLSDPAKSTRDRVVYLTEELMEIVDLRSSILDAAYSDLVNF